MTTSRMRGDRPTKRFSATWSAEWPGAGPSLALIARTLLQRQTAERRSLPSGLESGAWGQLCRHSGICCAILSLRARADHQCATQCRESSVVVFRAWFWGPEVEWHERDVVVPAFRQWLEAQGWETETETEFVDVVARRGNETIYAEVKGRTNSRPGAGLDTLYGQLLRRMPAEEVGDPNTRFAVVIPTGAEAAALRVPRRVRDVLRIDVYAVSDDGQVERLAD